MDTMPRVSIIILNWNGWKDTVECLESIYQITYPNYDVIVVDNGSVDGSIEKIKAYAEGRVRVESDFLTYVEENKPICYTEYSREETETGGDTGRGGKEHTQPQRSLTIIKNESNFGFAEGNNIALRYAVKYLNSDYLLLLNNDTVVDEGFLDAMVIAAVSDNRIGGLSPKMYFYSCPDRLQAVGVEIRKNIFNKLGIDVISVLDYKLIGHKQFDLGQYEKILQVDSLIGCCMLIRREAIIDSGYLDPIFFIYHEESDWLLRIKNNGYKLLCVPEARIWHKIFASSGGELSPTVAYYGTRNALLFAKKHNTSVLYFMYLLWFPVYGAKYIFNLAKHGRFNILVYFLSGFCDGISGKKFK